jgi:hypothetical protein
MSFKEKKDNIKTFSIDYESDIDNYHYRGKFTCKKLSIKDLSALGVRKAQLNGGFHYDAGNPGRGVDEQTDEMNNMVAHLELAIVDAPAWWDLDKITDLDLIAEVYKEVAEFEYSFLGRSNRQSSSDSESGDSSEANSGQTQERSESEGSSGPMVVEEVQSSTEP